MQIKNNRNKKNGKIEDGAKKRQKQKEKRPNEKERKKEKKERKNV